MAGRQESERRYRFGLMLVSLLLLVTITPCLPPENRTAARFGVTFLFSVLLLTSVYALSETRRSMIIAGTAAAPAVVLQWYVTVSQTDGVLVAAHVFGVLFLGYTVAVILRYLLTCAHVTANSIYASLCAYLLLGIIWALAYSLIDVMQPGAFTFALASDPGSWRMQFGGGNSGYALYYSFVTLTTLGYGDIAPVIMPARMLATLEAVTGQIYLAVLVARLVALQIAHSNSQASKLR